MVNKLVTLDIDSHAIRLLEVKGTTVNKWATAPLEPGEIEGGVASDYKALGLKIKQLMASSGIKAGKVTASVSGAYSVSRLLTVPNPPAGRSIQDIVLEMANEAMPLSGNKLYLLWQTVATGADTRKVLAVGVSRDAVDSEARSLKAAGITPYVMELKAIALARAVNREQALILNIEPSSFDIIIVVNGIPQVMHTIAIQESDLATEDWIEHLVINLEMTVDFYSSKYADTFNIDPAIPLFITGQMTEDISFMEKLQARLRYTVEPLAPPLEYPAHMPVSQYAINIGLALRETMSSKESSPDGFSPININLLPEEYWPWRPSARQLYTLVIVVMSLSLLFPLFSVAQEAMEISAGLNSKFTTLNNELLRRQMEIKKHEPLQQVINEYNVIVNKGGNFTEDLTVINKEAERLGVQIESITHVGGSIVVICQADEGDYITFREYKTALEASGRFTTPIPPPEGYPYTWRGTIKLTPEMSE